MHADYSRHLISSHRSEITKILTQQGFINPRLPVDTVSETTVPLEVLVDATESASLLDQVAAKRAMQELLGIEVDVIPQDSERGREIGDSAVAV